MSRFDGKIDIEALSPEELERYTERQLQLVVDAIVGGAPGRQHLWRLAIALEAVKQLRHVGRQQELFAPVSVAPVASHAVEPIGRYAS